ncbi:hypothetical protein A2851_03545 [Candidatus Kaiserbacteria bacterium RIFCSPHIGHO2_01_FULL_53_29]|uniref:Uncharacterized protein n=1 Tax=Candidatus Kaiserbacteria bacterium RIFCSPHIGHO2_01_FULL_53_29 TaxID=1798480 RepID=A0A1F6CY50_9BACT|nr:MAG: hypothetical protein A2851_03545 [Candidatus Kaiserbacteria bacterium RIFCSPHIGHO2_01_FULL_53_29]
MGRREETEIFVPKLGANEVPECGKCGAEISELGGPCQACGSWRVIIVHQKTGVRTSVRDQNGDECR